MSRVLVTGARGFIGSAIVRRLAADDHDVHAPGSDDLNLLTASEKELAGLIDKLRVSHCIHAAWYTNHADYLVHEINRDWVTASVRLATACKDIRFIGLGTCLEYDLSQALPCIEDQTPLAPRTLYATCKRDLFERLADLNSNFAWARVFFVYGPGDRAGRLVPKMLANFSSGKTFGPTSGGLQRDYIHVDDLADLIAQVAVSNVRGAINTATGEAPTLSQITEAAARALGTSQLARINDVADGEPRLIAADMARFRNDVGVLHVRNIEQGLSDLVQEMKRA